MEGASKPQLEPPIRSNSDAADRFHGLTRDQLVEAYRLMLLSRKIDDREIQLKRQNKAFFQINGVGHEAVLVACAMHLRPGRDWYFAYYRDRALALATGTTAFEQLMASVGALADPASGGRQMPSHWAHKKLNLVTQSSCVGTQFLHAVGAAIAGRYLRAMDERTAPAPAQDEIVYVSGGDGSTSEGEFWEALNNACLNRSPVLFLIEDNEYAISVPVERQTAGGSISRLVRGFPELFVTELDGCNFVESYGRLKDAILYLRAGRGPALVHAHVIRPYSHSLSDDERFYKTERERAEEAKRDPIPRMRKLLLSEGLMESSDLEALEQQVHRDVIEAADQALSMRWPAKDSWRLHLYSPTVDPTSAAFESEPELSGPDREGTMVDLLNACLRDEMKRDPRVLVFGQDVADASREKNLEEVKGKGGVFKVTFGLQREFGGRRVWNSPLAEASIVGLAVGAASRGLKPVVEIQFLDYIWPAFMQIRNEVATFRWRSNGAFSCPLVIRVPIGGYLKGGAIYHSQSGEVLFTHIPGLRVVMPSNALDANGLLRTAIRCDDPVLFLEHKHLYRQTYNKSRYPGPDYRIPFGKARRVKEGKHLTVVTYGALVQRSILAAQKAESAGVSVEILDLRSLAPYDWDAIASSVKKTNRVLVAYEDARSFGYGAEIASRISEELFDFLDAPVRRVAAEDCWVAYNPDLEDAVLPQVSDLEKALAELARY